LGTIQSHRDLIVWQRSMELVEGVYRLSAGFPRAEDYRMTGQLTRAAVSVPCNIAEGFARDSSDDYRRFLAIAKGSLTETDTLIRLGQRLGYVTAEQIAPILATVDEIGRMLTKLRQALKDSARAS